MLRLAAAVVVFAMGLVSAAHAQAYREGAYDGRAIPGWTYVSNRETPLPTWFPGTDEASSDGANCNVGYRDLPPTPLADWMAYFESVTPESFAASLTPGTVSNFVGHRIDVIDIAGRPAMRSLVGGRIQQSGVELAFSIVSISGANALVTITCTATAENMLARTRDFDAFVSGLRLLTAPPQ